jgi:glycosyltransferase involved in cell wall biosynthesis
MTTTSTHTSPRVAIVHAFLKSDCKGGGERLIFDMRNHYNADLFIGAIGLDTWGKHNAEKDSFVAEVWKPGFHLELLSQDSPIPIWQKIQRQLIFVFHPAIKKLNDYDIVIFSGNIGLAVGRITNPTTKKVLYCHTPPRPFTDQEESRLAQRPWILRSFFRQFGRFVRHQYRSDTHKMDLVITNSENIRQRLLKYIGIDSHVVYPAVNTKRFQYISTGDYFLSYTRLEEIKRIPLILEAFAQMPDKKLIIASNGPLKPWIIEQIATRKLTNITFAGMVSDQELAQLVGNCLAGIMIPVNEDAGITQCELMAAGKPVICVKEGGLLETVIDGVTGIMIPANPTIHNLQAAVQTMTPALALSMKEASQKHAQSFDSQIFFDKMDALLT